MLNIDFSKLQIIIIFPPNLQSIKSLLEVFLKPKLEIVNYTIHLLINQIKIFLFRFFLPTQLSFVIIFKFSYQNDTTKFVKFHYIYYSTIKRHSRHLLIFI